MHARLESAFGGTSHPSATFTGLACARSARRIPEAPLTARLLLGLAVLCIVGFVLTYIVALRTGSGLRLDGTLYRDVSGNAAAPLRVAGARALQVIDIGSVLVAGLLVALTALARGRPSRSLAGVVVLVGSIGSAEVIKHALPHIPGALPAGRLPSFPSGHASVAFAFGLALVLVLPSVLQPTAALIGAAYAAGIALSVIVLGAHYLSDVVGSLFLCGFWASVAGAALRGKSHRPHLSTAGLVIALTATAVSLLLAAELARQHREAVSAARSGHVVLGVAALLGVLSVALFASYAPLVAEEDG